VRACVRVCVCVCVSVVTVFNKTYFDVMSNYNASNK